MYCVLTYLLMDFNEHANLFQFSVSYVCINYLGAQINSGNETNYCSSSLKYLQQYLPYYEELSFHFETPPKNEC